MSIAQEGKEKMKVNKKEKFKTVTLSNYLIFGLPGSYPGNGRCGPERRGLGRLGGESHSRRGD